MRLRQADPNDADVAYMIAHEHAKDGDHDSAVQWFDTCLGIDGSYHYAYFHKARSLEAMGKPGEVIEVLRSGLARARADGAGKAAGEIEGFLVQVGG